MPAEGGSGRTRGRRVVAGMTARRAVRSAVLWGLLFAYLIRTEAVGWHADFPTQEARAQFAHSFGSSGGLTAVAGPARALDTVGGVVAWRMFSLMLVAGAIWGLLTATRLLRGEEAAGRWELLLAGRTARRSATVQALGGLAAAWLVLWALTAAGTVWAARDPDVGFSVQASLFYATAGTASAALFLAIGALASQLSATRREANLIAAGVFAVAYVVRMVADAGTGLAWLRWVSPLGWIENLAPLTGSNPLALVPVVVLTAAAAGGAVLLAGRRDVGAGVLGNAEAAEPDTRLLGSPGRLVVRLERWVGLAWIGGLALLALLFGVVAQAAARGNVAVAGIEQTVGRLGGRASGPAAAWIGYEFVFLAALVAFAAAGQVSAMRGEEADGHLDNLLARPVGRGRWLAGHLAFAAGLVVAAGLACGLGGWVGLAVQGGSIGLPAMLQAGLNVAVPGLFVLGVGTLLYALAPRVALPVLYAFVLWSFVVQIIGTSITGNHWVIDTAVLSHIGPVPAADLRWSAVGWLVGLGAAAVLAAVAAFGRRDLTAA